MVDDILGTSNTYYNPNLTSSQGDNVMGKDDFLKLMIEQLKNQNPLDPMDGSEYAAQLAQFTSLEQLTNLNESVNRSIDANYLLTQSINNTMTATLIGNEAKIGGSDITYTGQESVTLGYDLPASATSVGINIYNEAGVLIKSIKDAPTISGDHKLSWDFTDNNGSKLPIGKYTFEVEAISTSGEKMAITSYKYGKIDGVKFTEQGALLMVGGVAYMPSDILELINANYSGDTDNG